MDPNLPHLSPAMSMGVAALAGAYSNRFKDVAAGMIALATGVSPWLFVAIIRE
jgi:hypothetical protein